MIGKNLKNRLEALVASPGNLLRNLNRGLQMGCMLAVATVSQCNYAPSTNFVAEECCVPVEDIADCPCIVTDDIIDG